MAGSWISEWENGFPRGYLNVRQRGSESRVKMWSVGSQLADVTETHRELQMLRGNCSQSSHLHPLSVRPLQSPPITTESIKDYLQKLLSHPGRWSSSCHGNKMYVFLLFCSRCHRNKLQLFPPFQLEHRSPVCACVCKCVCPCAWVLGDGDGGWIRYDIKVFKWTRMSPKNKFKLFE